MSARPLFILAPPRSFTSVVCGMIGQHPEMYGLPEVNLFAGDRYAALERDVYHRRPGFRHGLLRAVAELGLGGQTRENVAAAQQWLEEQREATTAQIYGDLVAWAAPRRLVDKSPMYTYSPESLARIAATFPDASYLHLTRHPRGTCESVYRLRAEIRKRQQQSRFGPRMQSVDPRLATVEDPASLWLKPQLNILAFLEGIPQERKLRVRGEDFMADPDRYLPAICEWLGISTAPDAIEAMKHPERSPFARMGPVNALFGNDPNYLRDPVLRRYTPKPLSLEGPLEGGDGATLNGEVARCARALGYE